MVCDPDEVELDTQIPAVMLPQDAGATLENMLRNGSSDREYQHLLRAVHSIFRPSKFKAH